MAVTKGWKLLRGTADPPPTTKRYYSPHLTTAVVYDIILKTAIDTLFLEAEIKGSKGHLCRAEMKHHPIFGKLASNEALDQLCLVSRAVRDMVNSKRYHTLTFHGGGAAVAEDWYLLLRHMQAQIIPKKKAKASNTDKAKPLPAPIPILPLVNYVKRILIARTVSDKDYAQNLHELTSNCPNLETLNPSAAFYLQETSRSKKIKKVVPSKVRELVIQGFHATPFVTGLGGDAYRAFTRSENFKLYPFYREVDFKQISRLTIIPSTQKWKSIEGHYSQDHHRYEFEHTVSGDYKNLVGLKALTLDLTEFPICPLATETLTTYAGEAYIGNPAFFMFEEDAMPPTVLQDLPKSQHSALDQNMWLYWQMKCTPPLQVLEEVCLEVALDYFFDVPECLTYDCCYWIQQWLSALRITAKHVRIKVHLLSPKDYMKKFSERSKTPIQTMPKNWLLDSLPSNEKIVRTLESLREGQSETSPNFSRLSVELVRKRFRINPEDVVLKSWTQSYETTYNTDVRTLGKLSVTDYDNMHYVNWCDHHNTMGWKQRADAILHNVPSSLAGMV